MKNVRHRSLITVLLVFFAHGLAPSGLASDRSFPGVTVHLLRHVRSDREIIRVGDVAALRGGSQRSRERIADIEILEWPASRPSAVVTAKQLRIHCALQGFDRTRVRVEGSAEAILSRSSAMAPRRSWTPPAPGVDAETAVTRSISRELGTLWGVPESDIIVRLIQPLPARTHLPDRLSQRDIRVYLPALPEPGEITPNVVINAPGSKRIPIRVHVVARYKQPAVIGQARLSDSQGPVRLASATRTTAARPNLGRPARRGTPDVRPRDVITVTARFKSGLTVRMSEAEVRQQGWIGDFVTLRNIQTKREIVARLISSGEAVIDF